MNEFKNAKEAYDNTPIPAELSERVRAGVREGKARYRARRGRTLRRWGPPPPALPYCWRG